MKNLIKLSQTKIKVEGIRTLFALIAEECDNDYKISLLCSRSIFMKDQDDLKDKFNAQLDKCGALISLLNQGIKSKKWDVVLETLLENDIMPLLNTSFTFNADEANFGEDDFIEIPEYTPVLSNMEDESDIVVNAEGSEEELEEEEKDAEETLGEDEELDESNELTSENDSKDESPELPFDKGSSVEETEESQVEVVNAEREEKSLVEIRDDNGNVNCTNCIDCINCTNCHDCVGCINCDDCIDCYSCNNCSSCSCSSHLTNCYDCSTCMDCKHSDHLVFCMDCKASSNVKKDKGLLYNRKK